MRKMSANETSPESHVASKRRVLPWLPIERLPQANSLSHFIRPYQLC